MVNEYKRVLALSLASTAALVGNRIYKSTKKKLEKKSVEA